MLEVNNPSTVYIRFLTNDNIRFFSLDNVESKDRYYFRYLNGRTPRIKFNIPDPGKYTGNVPFEVVKIVPIEIPNRMPQLPPANRDRWKPVQLVYNNNIGQTPIRIFTETGIIEYNDRFLSFIKPIQIFLIEHEKGHMFYTSEEDCDLFALVNFLRMGYNQSTALFALTHVLHRSRENIERFKNLFDHIQKIRA